jgi:SNF2 family DNA or RNA helicase
MIQARFPHAEMFMGRKEETKWNEGNTPLMLLHPQRGGHGTNLQHGGRTMIFFSPFWDLELRMQVIDRIGPVRQKQAGYDRAVNVIDIVALDTLDSEVLDRLTVKRSVLDALMAARAHRG